MRLWLSGKTASWKAIGAGQDAGDADQDGGALDDPGADAAEGAGRAELLEHRVERDGGADAGEGHDHLEEAAQHDGDVGGGAAEEAGPRTGR
jgi:hypothetical protein